MKKSHVVYEVCLFQISFPDLNEHQSMGKLLWNT